MIFFHPFKIDDYEILKKHGLCLERHSRKKLKEEFVFIIVELDGRFQFSLLGGWKSPSKSVKNKWLKFLLA